MCYICTMTIEDIHCVFEEISGMTHEENPDSYNEWLECIVLRKINNYKELRSVSFNIELNERRVGKFDKDDCIIKEYKSLFTASLRKTSKAKEIFKSIRDKKEYKGFIYKFI